jgi:hypothetical protein
MKCITWKLRYFLFQSRRIDFGKHKSVNGSVRAVSGLGLWPIAVWNCGFESSRRNGCLSVVSFVCYQVEVSATDRSLVQRSPTDCSVSECDSEASVMSDPESSRSATGKKK